MLNANTQKGQRDRVAEIHNGVGEEGRKEGDTEKKKEKGKKPFERTLSSLIWPKHSTQGGNWLGKHTRQETRGQLVAGLLCQVRRWDFIL